MAGQGYDGYCRKKATSGQDTEEWSILAKRFQLPQKATTKDTSDRDMSSNFEIFASHIKSALRWWADELLSIIPRRIRNALSHQSNTLKIISSGGRLALVNEPREAGPADWNETPPTPEEDSRVWTRLAELRRLETPVRVSLCVPLSACLERRFDIPAVARREIDQIVNLELERATPFRIRDVYSAYVLEPAAAGKEGISVRQFIMKRTAVASAQNAINDAGAEIGEISCLDKEGSGLLPINFLSRPDAASATRIGTAGGLALLCLLLAVSAVGVSVVRTDRALSDIQVQTAQARADWEERQRSAATSLAALDGARAVETLQARYVPTVVVIEELTRLLPDDVHISDLKVADGVIAVSGFAPSTSSLVPLLESSSLFTAAELTAPVTIDAATDKERFSLRFRLRTTEPATAQKTIDAEEPL